MADRKVTVVNPAGYQEQLPDTDNLLVAAAPTIDFHAANKLYVDTQVGNIDLSDIESQLDDLQDDIGALDLRVSAIENTYATENYVDTTVSTAVSDLETALTAVINAGDQNLQDQIDALIAQGELQTLQDVTDLGSTTTNDMTSEGTITAATLVGDMDYGEY